LSLLSAHALAGWPESVSGRLPRQVARWASAPVQAMIWDPSDANPLHRRLPAEVTSRRHRPTEKRGPTAPKEEEQVSVDQKTAITLKPDARPKWLSKACKQTQEGKASSTELYNIVVSRRFSAGLPERIGKKLATIVQKYLDLFSEKQRKHLQSPDFHLNAIEKDGEEEDEEVKQQESTARSEAMLATCRDFVREQAESFEARQKVSDEREAAEADRAARMVEEATKRNAKEAAQREDRQRFNAFDADLASERAAADREAEKRRKLEEEADKLFEFAMAPQPPARESSRRDGRDRSRSVSAAEASPSPPRRRHGSWRSSHPGELTGSRAILLNRDFQEDLPHLPRPVQGSRPAVKLLQSSAGSGSGLAALPDRAEREPRERSRSRDRHRDRRSRSRRRRR